MKITKIALECLCTLVVTGVLVVVVLLGSAFANDGMKTNGKDCAQRSAAMSADCSLDKVCEIQPYDQNVWENKNTNSEEGIMAMESPDFQECIESMRQLTPEEIDDMYEYYKNKATE